MAEYKGTRAAFSTALLEMAREDDRCMLVCADSLKAMRATAMAAELPAQCVDVGISEQEMVLVSAGLATLGLIPFAATYCGFLTMRACEQVRTFAAYPHLKVRLVGINGGLMGGEREGVTHQSFEDLGILRAIPGITVVAPADAHQVYHATKAIKDIEGPVYLRCGSGREKTVYRDIDPFVLGRLCVLRDYGSDCVIFCNGFLMSRALEAAEILKGRGVNVTLADVHTLKPLDAQGIGELLGRCGCAVTVEDHNIIGGLGSAVAETAAELCPVPMARVGLRDLFPSSGAAEELADYYGMAVSDIVSAVLGVIERKK